MIEVKTKFVHTDRFGVVEDGDELRPSRGSSELCLFCCGFVGGSSRSSRAEASKATYLCFKAT